jgi:hypothetical protein
MMEEELEISKETTCRFTAVNVGKKEICARVVPHCLTDEQTYE